MKFNFFQNQINIRKEGKNMKVMKKIERQAFLKNTIFRKEKKKSILEKKLKAKKKTIQVMVKTKKKMLSFLLEICHLQHLKEKLVRSFLTMEKFHQSKFYKE